MSSCMHITSYSHFFKVSQMTSGVQRYVENYYLKWRHYTFVRKSRGQFSREPTKVFAMKLEDHSEYRFHAHLFHDFRRHLLHYQIHPHNYVVEQAPIYTPAPAELIVRPQWVPRDHQTPIIDYLLTPSESHSKMVQIRTGQGKTFISLYAISQLGQRTVILLKTAYIEKWVDDLLKTYELDPSRIMLIQGSKALKRLTKLAVMDEVDADAIIIPIRTYQTYLDAYDISFGSPDSLGYACTPEELFRGIQAGVLLIDEVHQQFHAVFRTNLYTHVPLSISLSATLVSDDPFIKRMHDVAYPRQYRYVQLNIDNYIRAIGVSYGFKRPEYIRTTDFGATTYSHHAFEKSVIKYPKRLADYLALIRHVAQIGYFDHYQPGDKLAIFAASIQLCDLITQDLKKRYTHLDIRRYVQEDPYENIIEPDIRVTTVGSGGTAIDIPDLRCVIQTVNILSSASNIQTLGRLRKLPDRDVTFIYLWCNQIPKHVEYHKRRVTMLEGYTSSIKQLDYHDILN